MANENNLKPFTKENASYYGKLGGMASGKVRKKKSLIKKQFNIMLKISDYIDSMNDIEYKDFMSDYSEAEQQTIEKIFKPSKKQIKDMCKNLKL